MGVSNHVGSFFNCPCAVQEEVPFLGFRVKHDVRTKVWSSTILLLVIKAQTCSGRSIQDVRSTFCNNVEAALQHRQTDRKTDRKPNGKTDRQAGRPTDRQRETDTDIGTRSEEESKLQTFAYLHFSAHHDTPSYNPRSTTQQIPALICVLLLRKKPKRQWDIRVTSDSPTPVCDAEKGGGSVLQCQHHLPFG